MAKKKYDIKKTIRKGIEIFIYGGVSYLITYLANIPQKPEYLVAIMSILKMVENYMKHRK